MPASEGFILTPEFRVGFPSVFTPKEGKPGTTPKYEMTMLFRKEDKKLLAEMQNMVKAKLTEKFPDPSKKPAGLKMPFGDGDTKDWDGFAGCYFVRCKSQYLPGIVGPDSKPIINPGDFYGGCYARAEINCYYYDTDGNRGVAIGLSNIQKLRDGETFGNRQKPEEVFDPVTPTEDSDELYGGGTGAVDDDVFT